MATTRMPRQSAAAPASARLPLALPDGSPPPVFPLDPPPSARAYVSTRLVHDVVRLSRLRFSGDRREEIIATLVRGMKRVAPGFATRPMRMGDVLRACRRERILLEWGSGRSESLLLRHATAGTSIRLSPSLSRHAVVFCAFTELAHWLGHPMAWDDAHRLDVAGLMHQEACTLGYLALFPHPAGRPYPIFLGSERLEEERGAHRRLTVWRPTRHRTGSLTWATRRIDVLWYPHLPLPSDRPWFADGGAWE